MTRLDEIEARLAKYTETSEFRSDSEVKEIWDTFISTASDDIRYLLDEVKRFRKTEENIIAVAAKWGKTMPAVASSIRNTLAK